MNPSHRTSTLRFCHAGRFEMQQNVAMHAHAFHELILVYRGTFNATVDNEEYVLQQGELLIVPMHESHDQRSDQVVGTLYVGGMWPEALLSHKRRVVSLRTDKFLERWLGDLVEHYKHESGLQSAVVIHSLLSAILGRVRWIEDGAGQSKQYFPQLAAAVRYIEAHMTDELTVADIAQHAGCSPSHLTALFRKGIQCSPVAYQMQCRLQLACKHLLEPYLNVNQIARACGWSDPNLFVRIFRQKMGCPPGQWRKQQTPQILPLVATNVQNYE